MNRVWCRGREKSQRGEHTDSALEFHVVSLASSCTNYSKAVLTCSQPRGESLKLFGSDKKSNWSKFSLVHSETDRDWNADWTPSSGHFSSVEH